MKVHDTEIIDLGADKARVTLILYDGEHLDDDRGSISLTVEVGIAGSPYLKEVQIEALELALQIIQQEISAKKTVPRPAS